MSKIVMLPVTSCLQCPHRKEANPWSSDGWDRMIDWICTLANDKKNCWRRRMA